MIEDYLRGVRSYYYNSPPVVREFIGRCYRSFPMSWRLGKHYERFSTLIHDGKEWSRQQFDDYQYEQLKNTLTTAYKHIPFYRSLYQRHGVSDRDFHYLDDLQKFPVINKRDVKENFKDMINKSIPTHRQLITTTGGSSAEPLRFLQLKSLTRSKEKAFIGAGWGRVNYDFTQRAVQVRGRSVGNPRKGVFWEYEPIQNILEMDSNYLVERNIPAYLEAMRDFKGDYLIGFPSSIYLIAKFAKDNNMALPSFRAVMLGSENVYAWQIELLEEVFSCRVFSHYGHSEMALLGMGAPDSHDLLFFPQYGYLEILDANAQRLTEVGAKGELVGTGFHNPVMPFIRYRTQDYGVIGKPNKAYPHYPVLSEIEGRLQEFIVTDDGRNISVCTMGAAHFDTLDNVYATQYYQPKAGELEFHVVRKKTYSDSDDKKILNALKGKLGEGVDVTLRYVDDIKRSPTGKHMMLIQGIPHEQLLTPLDVS